jgi:two-component system invasion response regulator UvrY
MIHIAIVDDHAVIRAGLGEFLAGYEDIRVVGEAANGREAIELVRRLGPDLDVLMLDLKMPGQSGQEVLALIKAKAPCLAVLILSGYPEEVYATSLLRNGASGYLKKDCAPEMMIEAIRRVAKGRHYLTPEVAELSVDRLTHAASLASHELLTAREFQVLLRLARGQGTPAISQELSLSAKTISHYRTQLLRKMDLRSNGDLTFYAVKNRLID